MVIFVRNYILIFMLAMFSSQAIAVESFWQPISKGEGSLSGKQLPLYQLDEGGLKSFLESSNQAKDIDRVDRKRLDIPLPDGSKVTLLASKTSVMAAELAAKYPEIKHWKVKGVENPQIYGVVGFNTRGFHGMLFMPDGDTVFIERDRGSTGHNPIDHNSTDHSKALYKSLSKRASVITAEKTKFSCGVLSTDSPINLSKYNVSKSTSFAARRARGLVTYRLAMAATGEYTKLHRGAVNAIEEITKTVARINEIYERDLAIRLELVNQNDTIIFTNPDTDPYSNGGNILSLARENAWSRNNAGQIVGPGVIDQYVGADNYDIGHVVSVTRGGVALVGSVCQVNRQTTNHKAGASTGSNAPSGDFFDIDFVAHEIGHQLGATHTFNSTSGSCGGGERAAATAYEPGSGSSIMAYAGICRPNNVQRHSDASFHIGSIEQINTYARNQQGSLCGTESGVTNTAPDIISVTENLVVDANTAFILTGSANDIDGDSLTYSWDQFDAGSESNINVDRGNNALFRSHLPSSSPERLFPALATSNRNLTFKFVVRDGKGGVSSRTTTVRIVNGNTNSGSIRGSGSTTPFVLLGLLLLVALRKLSIKEKGHE